MSTPEEQFLEELRKVFAAEAEEHLQTLASGLVAIEKAQAPAVRQASLEAVYRAAHSLKGAARSVNLPVIASICQSMETVLSAMKKGQLSPAAEDFDVLQRAVDKMTRLMTSSNESEAADVKALIGQLERVAAGASQLVAPSSPPPEEVRAQEAQENHHLPMESAAASGVTAAADTIRVKTAKLDAVLLRTEELISIKLAAEQRITELSETLDLIEGWKKEWQRAEARARGAAHRQEAQSRIRASAPSPLSLSHAPDAFDKASGRFRDLNKRLSHLKASLMADKRATSSLVNQLLEETKGVLMLPFSTLLQSIPKMVRDISREQGKDVNVVVGGAEIEIYKRVLERMKDPLLHLLRNAIDHGIETADERRALNKPPSGTITVRVSQAEGSHVLITVADDGAGIDTRKLRTIAAERDLLSREAAEALDEQSALMLIFQSGVSTSARITDLSGRGLGMAIVQEAVDKLGGRISVETVMGKGTTVSMTLPLTLATSHGLLLREYGQLFVIPIANVERVLRINTDDIRTLENRETILFEGVPLSVVRLGAVLNLDGTLDDAGSRSLLSLLVLAYGQKRIAFAIERLLGEQEILIKGLGKQLRRVRNIAGATVLGNGKVVPILNVADLMTSAVKTSPASVASRTVSPSAPRKSVLVVEDSITSRLLLKNILAAAGFDVCTAVDGTDAWSALEGRRFDLVVSDIEMPRMNGFELTAKIRADERLSGLPVILVTALESKADRERGAEAGADAYIVKSSFDQSNLLEVARRLI